MATARNVGMVLGVGISGAIFTTILSQAEADPHILYHAASVSFMVAAGFAIAGVLSSSVRNMNTSHQVILKSSTQEEHD
jgi:ABC-type Fe3+-siderophore transport system permease subunit